MDDRQFLHENIHRLRHHFVIFQHIGSEYPDCIIKDMNDRAEYSGSGKDIYEAFRKVFEKMRI